MLAGALRRRGSGAKNHFPGRSASARDTSESRRVYRHKSFLIRGIAGGEQPSDLGRIWAGFGIEVGVMPAMAVSQFFPPLKPPPHSLPSLSITESKVPATSMGAAEAS